MAEMWRLFIALELPPDIVAEIAALQTWLKERTPPRTVRWTKPEGIHLTLKFLGDVPVARRETLETTLQNAVHNHKPFMK